MRTSAREFRGPPRRAFLKSLVACLGGVAMGCGWWPDAGAGRIWGRVLCKGAPVGSGAVILMPASDRVTTWGVGAIDPSGRFEIESARLDASLEPGRYLVYIRPPAYTDPETLRPAPPPGYPVPAKYLDFEAPAISVEIGPEPMRLDLTLED